MNSKLHFPKIPAELVSTLDCIDLQYTTPKTIFHAITVSEDWIIGVVGDGGNACYEWFSWKKGNLATSDRGYGDTLIALRALLNEVAL